VGASGTHRTVSRDSGATGSHGVASRDAGASGTHGTVSRDSGATDSHGVGSRDAGASGTHRTVSRDAGVSGAHRTVSRDGGATGGHAVAGTVFGQHAAGSLGDTMSGQAPRVSNSSTAIHDQSAAAMRTSVGAAESMSAHGLAGANIFADAAVGKGTYAGALSGPDPSPIAVDTGPIHATWDIPLDGLPKVARLEPIRPRRWPWVFLGVLAGAAAAVYFWLPRFDTRELPPEVAAVVTPLQTAIEQSSASIAAVAGNNASSPTTADQTGAAPVTGADAATVNTATAGEVGSAVSGGKSGVGAVGSAVSGGKSGVGAVGSAVSGGKSGAGAVGSAVGSGRPVASASGKYGVPGGSSTSASYGTNSGVSTASAATVASGAATAGPAVSNEQRLRDMRQTFDTRIAALEARGAGVWGGREFAMAKTRAAESVGAHDAGNARVAQEKLDAAMKLLDTVDGRAPQALSSQVAVGEKALGTGQQEVAGQAFDLARRINPADRRATDGQRRAQNLNAVLPLLADAQNAEADHDYARAAQDYSQALSLDPGNATAKAGQLRANASFGDDNYAKAVGTGFAALGAGRLDEAHEAFVKARALKPNSAEASEGLRRVSAALTARGFASMRQRALGLEAQERWEEAERVYEDVLAADPSLAFAQEGKARTTSRADLSLRLQQFLDRPDRLSTAAVREDARALLETARAQSPQGPAIRSQIARLELLLPGFDRPVRLSLVSDNTTQIVIPSIGAFGTFARRDIELRPGKYTVVGTRNGFRDVRREITVAPGQGSQIIRVSCSDPI
jgi:tetratricopeptide (TPR) repeat protein